MTSRRTGKQPVRSGVIGVNHINGMTDLLLKAGGERAMVYAAEDDLAAAYAARYPQARRARSQAEILEDDSIALVASAALLDERAGLGIATMQHGKDYLSDKLGFTTLDQLERARNVPFAPQLLDDIRHPTETELAVRAQLQAKSVTAATMVVA